MWNDLMRRNGHFHTHDFIPKKSAKSVYILYRKLHTQHSALKLDFFVYVTSCEKCHIWPITFQSHEISFMK